MVVNLTEAEANNLLALLDVATKAGGLNAAQAALPLATKIQQALATTTNENTQAND